MIYLSNIYLFVAESFQAEEECGGDWAVDTVDSLARAGQDWGSWDAADQDSSSSAPSTNTVTENVFDIMRDGSLSQVRPSINIFYIHTKNVCGRLSGSSGSTGWSTAWPSGTSTATPPHTGSRSMDTPTCSGEGVTFKRECL